MLVQSWSMRVPDFFESLRVVFGCGIEFIDEHACAEIPHILFFGAKKGSTITSKNRAPNSEGALSTFTVVGLIFACECGPNFGVIFWMNCF